MVVTAEAARVGRAILYCLGAADIAPGLRLRQTTFTGVITAVHPDGIVDLTYFPPPEASLGSVVQASRVPHKSLAPAGRSFWEIDLQSD